jgi:predicted transcriptional regulator of viral defense system
MKPQEFFAKTPVFTREEFARAISSVAARAAEKLLAYHLQAKHIVRVRRGLYASVPLGSDPETYPVDSYLLASRMVPDAVIAYHSALEFYGRAYSVHNALVFLTEHATRSQTFRNVRFTPVKSPKKLRDKNLGVVAVEHLGLQINVTSRERTLVDVLDRPKISGGLEEVWRSLEMFDYFALDNVVEYAMALKNATTVSTVGFFLEQHREALNVDDVVLKKLKKRCPKKPHYLVRNRSEESAFFKEWNLLVPRSLLTRSWDELS